MGALRQPRLNGSLKKPPVPAQDKYGRDPLSPSERLRGLTDYAADTGYSPLYHAMLADMPRLVGSLVGVWILHHVLRLTYGQDRRASTAPISAAELADLCRANVRDIQRQLSEMSERGLIKVKMVKTGGVKYSISLCLGDWREIEDYAVWKRNQLVVMDSAEDSEAAEDEAPAAISHDAVNLTRKPQAVRPGRAMKAVKVAVGVKEFSFQNDSKTVDLTVSAVVQSGRLLVSATCAKGESEAKGEVKANAERHACRDIPSNGGSKVPLQKGERPARADELLKLFDPLLQASGSRLLVGDFSSLVSACESVADCDHDYLVKFAIDRGARPITSPKHVASICADALASWRAGRNLPATVKPIAHKKTFAESVRAAAQRKVDLGGKV